MKENKLTSHRIKQGTGMRRTKHGCMDVPVCGRNSEQVKGCFRRNTARARHAQSHTACSRQRGTQIVNVPNIVTTPLPLTGWSGLYGAAISYSGGVIASGTQGGMSRSLGGLVPGVMATVTVNMRYVRKLPFSISVIDDASGTVVANQNITSGPLVPYSLSFIPTGNNVTLRIEEGVGFTSSGTLLHLASGTYTQQQGWTTAPLAVQLSNKDADKYKFGFNGQEKVNEIAGIGNHTTALFWEYDTRIARRWNRDPVDQISISNYSVMRLNPILFNDPLGDCPDCPKDGKAGDRWTSKGGAAYDYDGKDWKRYGGQMDEMVVTPNKSGTMRDMGRNNLNIMQAAERGIGFNAYNRQRATWSRNIAAGWLGAGFAAPAAVVGGSQLGLVALFKVSTDMALVKGGLSWGSQALMNGWREVDYADVIGDAFTAPLLNGLWSGGVDWKPFSATEPAKLRIQGIYNSKSASQFGLDAAIGFGSSYVGDAAWKPLEYHLKTPTEKTIFYLSTQISIGVGAQGAGKAINSHQQK